MGVDSNWESLRRQIYILVSLRREKFAKDKAPEDFMKRLSWTKDRSRGKSPTSTIVLCAITFTNFLNSWMYTNNKWGLYSVEIACKICSEIDLKLVSNCGFGGHKWEVLGGIYKEPYIQCFSPRHSIHSLVIVDKRCYDVEKKNFMLINRWVWIRDID